VEFQYRINHLLVDLDGTLLGNHEIPLSLDFMRHALLKLKDHGGWKKAASTLLAIKRELEIPSNNNKNSERVVNLFSERMGFPIDQSRQFIKESLVGFFPKLEQHFYPVPGAKEFLEWAKNHFSLTLATNPVWPREIVDLRLKWAGVDPELFNVVTTATNSSACKPEAKYFTEILDHLNYDVEECLLIGDEVKMDLPATEIGLLVYIVGDYTNMTRVSHPGAKSPAWKGSYVKLKESLEQMLLAYPNSQKP